MLFVQCIKTRFTSVAQNVHHHQHHHLHLCSSGHVWSWSVAPFHRSRGRCHWFGRHQKCVFEVYIHLQLELNTLGIVSVSTDKNLKDWGRANVWATTSKTVCGRILILTSLLGLVWEAHCWRMLKHFRYTLYKYSTLYSVPCSEICKLYYIERNTRGTLHVFIHSVVVVLVLSRWGDFPNIKQGTQCSKWSKMFLSTAFPPEKVWGTDYGAKKRYRINTWKAGYVTTTTLLT